MPLGKRSAVPDDADSEDSDDDLNQLPLPPAFVQQLPAVPRPPAPFNLHQPFPPAVANLGIQGFLLFLQQFVRLPTPPRDYRRG